MVGFPLGLQRACSVPAACTACFKFIIGYNSPIVKKKNGKNGKQINFKNPEIGPTWPRNRCAISPLPDAGCKTTKSINLFPPTKAMLYTRDTAEQRYFREVCGIDA